MEWAIVFGGLCTVTDCAGQQIERWVLAAGAVMGGIMTGSRILQGAQTWYDTVLALLPGVLLWALSRLTEGKIGQGDGDMALVLGCILGWQQGLAVLCKACFLMAIYAGGGLAAGKLQKDSRLPFAPFLLAAAFSWWLLMLCGG